MVETRREPERKRGRSGEYDNVAAIKPAAESRARALFLLDLATNDGILHATKRSPRIASRKTEGEEKEKERERERERERGGGKEKRKLRGDR
jgi:hypothetical protein